MKGVWRVTRWRGAPVYVGWSVLLAVPFLVAFGHSWRGALLALPAYLFLIAVHEAGHAWVARRVGVPVLAIELHGMHGLCRYETPYYERDDVLIACGGVAAQLVVLALAWPLWHLLPLLPAQAGNALRPSMSMLVWANMLMIAFNLIPYGGLDGERAWKVLPIGWEWLRERVRGGVARRQSRKPARKPPRKPARRAALRVVPTTPPDTDQQMRDTPDEPTSPEAVAVAAQVLERMRGRRE
jgi:Zn-dependent protease